MATLTPCRVSTLDRVSLLNVTVPSKHSVSNHPMNKFCPFFVVASFRNKTSPFVLWLRHSFAGSPVHQAESSSYPTDCSFTSSCSPPRITATQLLSVTGLATSAGLDFHQLTRCARRRTNAALLTGNVTGSCQLSGPAGAGPVWNCRIQNVSPGLKPGQAPILAITTTIATTNILLIEIGPAPR